MKKRMVLGVFVVGFAVLVLLSTSSSASAQLHVRHADSVHTFVITAGAGGDLWQGTPSYGDSLGDLAHRYQLCKQDTELQVNSENRGLWSYLTGAIPPAPDSVAYGGPTGSFIDYITASPNALEDELANAFCLRIELERHQQGGSRWTQYDGFVLHDSSSGKASLVGRNCYDAGATTLKYAQQLSPQYCVDSLNRTNPSMRWSDTSINCLTLTRGRDEAGVFDDSLLDPKIFSVNRNSAYRHWEDDFVPIKKWVLRFRLKVDTTSYSSLRAGDTLFMVTTRQYDTYQDTAHVYHSLTDTALLNTPVVVDSNLHNVGTGWDTVDVHMVCAGNADSTVFSLYWLGHVSLTMDYLEVLTAQLDSTDTANDFVGYPPPAELRLLGAQRLLQHNADTLKSILQDFSNRFNGKVDWIQTGEEYPLATERIIKRARKLLQNICGDAIQFYTIVHDSVDLGPFDADTRLPGYTNACTFNADTAGFYGFGLPNQFVYQVEGVRLGWEDSTLYADPKLFVIEPYPIGAGIPLPRRLLSTDSATDYRWDTVYQPIAHGQAGHTDCPGGPAWVLTDTNYRTGVPAYTPTYYTLRSEESYSEFLLSLRTAERACIRNAAIDQHFWLSWQCGARPGVNDINWGRMVMEAGLREPTGPELKIQAYLAQSCGATGLFMYLLADGTDKDSTQGGGNGGLMNWDGNHSTNLYTYVQKFGHDTSKTDAQTLWCGWKERFDTAKSIIPVVRTYGDTLLHCIYIGDWLASEAIPNTLPFVPGSIKALSDSSQMDLFVPLASDSVYPIKRANRTFVHVSVWVDTAHGQSDTLLYITNMRTDDSYVWNAAHTDSIPGTMDRRLILLKLKRPHRVEDILDTNGSLDPGRVWTPYVGSASSDSLEVYLNAGDGILVRLMDTIPSQPQQAMTAPRIDYPKNNQTNHFYDHGRIVFDQPVPGVRNKSTGAGKDWSVPSTSRAYKVGVPNNDTVRMWQDSTLYQKPTTGRTQNWRSQNWSAPSITIFNFRQTILPLSGGGASQRVPQVSTDSIAHFITITTDLEGRGNGGKVKLYDPWFVDSSSLRNFNTSSDTLVLNSPWLPGYGMLNGGDEQHYGGVFLHQNDKAPRDSSLPAYGLSAYSTIRAGSLSSSDSIPNWIDWTFLFWMKTDSISITNDPEDWTDNVLMQTATPVVFRKDSAVYTAIYKAHMGALAGGPGLDAGFAWNNQKKNFYLYTDSLGNPWYRVVYSSAGRIFTAIGWRNHITNSMTFLPEQLVSDWSDTTAIFPAMIRHDVGTPYDFRYVYQDDGGNIVASWLGYPRALIQNIGSAAGLSAATPVVSGADINDTSKFGLDVVAWPSFDGIHVMSGDLGEYPAVTSPEIIIPPPFMVGDPSWPYDDTTAIFPTIWMDTSMRHVGAANDTCHFWLAYQADTVIPGLNPMRHDTVTCIYALELEATYPLHAAPTISYVPGQPSWPTNLMTSLEPLGVDSRHPCISGCRINVDTEVVRVSYELTENTDWAKQGIAVVQWRTGKPWRCDFLRQTSNPVGDQFWKPSIECTRYHDTTTTLKEDNYYSLAYERMNGTWIMNWALDSDSWRLPPYNPDYNYWNFANCNNPHLSVVPSSHDSLVREMGESISGDPLWIVYNTGGLFKVGLNDSLWEYRDVTEKDTTGTVNIEHGIGEITADDGATVKFIDLAYRSDTLQVDSLHDERYFLQSADFNLPKTGTLQYYRWVKSSNDSLFRLRLDAVTFALDFYDTAGNFVERMDSVTVSDSLSDIIGSLKSITLDGSSTMKGYLEFHRVTPNLSLAHSVWQDILTDGRYSTVESEKSGHKLGSTDTILLSAAPNPLRNQTTISFAIPMAGAVTIEAMDILGRTVESLADSREFHAGGHSLVWNTEAIHSGTYEIVLHYGNTVKTLRLSILK